MLMILMRDFEKILNKQGKHIQFTREDKNGQKCINFLDIKVKNNNGRHEFGNEISNERTN